MRPLWSNLWTRHISVTSCYSLPVTFVTRVLAYSQAYPGVHTKSNYIIYISDGVRIPVGVLECPFLQNRVSICFLSKACWICSADGLNNFPAASRASSRISSSTSPSRVAFSCEMYSFANLKIHFENYFEINVLEKCYGVFKKSVYWQYP